MVNHPAVLAEAHVWDSGRQPRLAVRSGISIVSYCRTRVHLDRDGWEMLPPDGVLLLRVEPADRPRFILALTRTELDNVFGEVRETRSWRDSRYYSFAVEPRAARAFTVDPWPEPVSGEPTRAQHRAPASAPRAHKASAARSTPRAPRALIRSATRSFKSFEEWAADWYARLQARPESVEYLRAVTTWREVWRPKRVRLLLLAESHVGEHPGDASVEVMPTRWIARELPHRFVRLIYCLGYGESEICTRRPEPNPGTPQFWNIFGQLARGESPPRKAEVPLASRLRWKVDVLNRLRDRGIWLQDASPLGIYLGRGKRLDPQHQAQLLREGYEHYVYPVLENDPPDQIWVIGHGVAAALAGLPGIDPQRKITQPQDRDRAQHLAGLERLRRAAS